MSEHSRVAETEAASGDPAVLQQRLAEARRDAKSLAAHNETLNRTLREARSQLVSMREELAAVAEPPLTRVRVVGRSEDQLDISSSGRVVRVGCASEVSLDEIEVGDQVLINDSYVVVAPVPLQEELDPSELGHVIEVDERFAVVSSGQDEARMRLVGELAEHPPEAGDTVLVDKAAGLALAVVPRLRADELVLEEIPDVSYADIGGLSSQIDQIRDAVELPFLHRDRFRAYGLKAPKGILLYGPPGCGKTMIAKAVARSLGDQLGGAGKATFISIKGPELLNKFVGETERQIRQVFERARSQATAGVPVIVFFDEMDALFRTRGSGVSSDVETTIVPQLLTEIDGVEGLDNVMIIGASNREDMIDPAILRPGRLDVKIKLERPNAEGATEIMERYLGPEVPLHPRALTAHSSDPQATRKALIAAAVDEVYAPTPANRFLEVTYASGDKETLMFADFASGAMLHNIVDRAKKIAIKAEIAGQVGGVSEEGMRQGAREEFTENEDLPNTTNPDDWARVSGRKGERIVFIRTLVGSVARDLDTEGLLPPEVRDA